MKNLSVKLKITLWFSIIIILITAMMFALMLTVSTSVLHTDAKETLKRVIDVNAQEIEYVSEIDENEYETGDQYIEYNNAYLEIDDDFLDESSGVYTALYDSDGNLLYGQNLINAEVSADGKIKTALYDKEKYYTFAKDLIDEELDGLVLFGVINENANKTILTRIINMSLIILPFLALFAIVGGYFLAGRLLRPVRDITQLAENITDGNDLSKRIKVSKSNDEFNKLADTFNKMFERLENSFYEERQFTSDISHELRTPVSTILAQCEYTMEKERDTGEYINALSVIDRQGIRMKNIVEQMLRYSRLEKLNEIPNPQTVNLSALFNEIAQEQKSRNVRSITISSNIEDNIFVTGDSDMLESLINNLISNAYRYGRDNGNIYLSLKENEKEIVLSVQDDGIGINQEAQSKIFNRFYQEDKSRTVKDAEYSIGLGLSMVNVIAKLHGGYMQVESQVGEGSTFYFKIPKNIDI